MMKDVEISSPMPGVLLLEFPDQELLCRTFCRVQEHYESPEFAGRVFTLGEFRSWYTAREGAWSYYDDWGGFNVPDSAFKALDDGSFDPLTPEEAWLAGVRRGAGAKYVIGAYKGCAPDVVPHELSHAMFRLNDVYRIAVLGTLAQYDLTDLKEWLVRTGYGPNVILDECHAYLGESTAGLDRERVDYPAALPGLLRAIKAKYLALALAVAA